MAPIDPELPLVPAPLLSPAVPPTRSVLTGPLGLRAGWGILLFLVLAALLGTGLFMGLSRATGQYAALHAQSQADRLAREQARKTHTHPPVVPNKPAAVALSETTQLTSVLLAAAALALLEKRRFGVYGLGRVRVGDAAAGAGAGLLAMGLLIAALRAGHLLVFDHRMLGGSAALGYGAVWLGIFVLVGASEEFLFRGYLQFTLMRGLLALASRLAPGRPRLVAFWMSAVLWSLLFLAAHVSNSGETATGLAVVFLAGIVFSYALWRTGSLWWGVGAHTAWDWAQSFLFGVPDSGTLTVGRMFQTHAVGPAWLSGGVDGPEGSVLVIPALLLLLLAVRLHKAEPQPPVEPGGRPEAGMDRGRRRLGAEPEEALAAAGAGPAV